MRKLLTILIALLLAPATASAVKIADITRIGGQRTNVLMGLGLVYGLKGTGDGGSFSAAINPLAQMLGKFADTVSVAQLGNAQNVAIVAMTATVPANGARNGDHIDVHVMSLGAASSLQRGHLFLTPLRGPMAEDILFAMAEGPITIEDPSDPLVGVVPGGCVMEADLPAKSIDQAGRFTLILDEPSASWTTASTMAKIINDALSTNGETIAVAVDQKNVLVTIPPAERERPDIFISNVERLPVPILPTRAIVRVNERTGTIIMTGDVEISPVVISHNGLTITTLTPAPHGTPRNPLVDTKDAVALDTTAQGGPKLQELLDALQALRVPAQDRITIIKELHKTGKLHATLETE